MGRIKFASKSTITIVGLIILAQFGLANYDQPIQNIIAQLAAGIALTILSAYAYWWLINRSKFTIYKSKRGTSARSWLGYWPIGYVLLAVVFIPVNFMAAAALLIAGQFVLPLGWIAIIAWDVRSIYDDLDGGIANYLYPALGLFSGIGVLVYVWDRERNLPNTS